MERAQKEEGEVEGGLGKGLSEAEGLGGKKRRGLMTFDLGLGEENDVQTLA